MTLVGREDRGASEKGEGGPAATGKQASPSPTPYPALAPMLNINIHQYTIYMYVKKKRYHIIPVCSILWRLSCVRVCVCCLAFPLVGRPVRFCCVFVFVLFCCLAFRFSFIGSVLLSMSARRDSAATRLSPVFLSVSVLTRWLTKQGLLIASAAFS